MIPRLKKIEHPYGSYDLLYWRNILMRRTQAIRFSWVSWRLALLCRQLAMRGWRKLMGGEAEGFRMCIHIAENVSECKFFFMSQFIELVERRHIRKRLRAGWDVFVDLESKWL